MEVLNLKESMKIKQQMAHRNLESRGCECQESPGSTVHQMGYRGGTAPGWGWTGDKPDWSNALGTKVTFVSNVCSFVTFSPLSYLYFAISFSNTDVQGLRSLEWQIFFPFQNSP